MIVAHQKREHKEAAECVFYVTSYVTILSFIKCGCHELNKSVRWRPERSAGKQIMLAQQRAAITAYLFGLKCYVTQVGVGVSDFL